MLYGKRKKVTCNIIGIVLMRKLCERREDSDKPSRCLLDYMIMLYNIFSLMNYTEPWAKK